MAQLIELPRRAVETTATAVTAPFRPLLPDHSVDEWGRDDHLVRLLWPVVRLRWNVSVGGLVAAVQAAHADLVAAKGALLVTGGGFAYYDPKVDAMATQWGAMGLAVSKAAQHKAVGLLAAKLGSEGVYVGEVVVLGMVKGTAFDSGHATLDANDIAAKFWEMHGARSELSVNFG